MSKQKHFHLSILKLGEQKLEKYEKIEQIRHVANDVYEDLSDNDRDFNYVYNPNVREISRDFFSVDYIVLYRDEM